MEYQIVTQFQRST